jgi:hypothetical protein
MKDFYDLHLFLSAPEQISINQAFIAFENTWNFRHPNKTIHEELFEDWCFVLDEIEESKRFKEEYWPNYTKERPYASALDIEDIIQEIRKYLLKLREEFIKL